MGGPTRLFGEKASWTLGYPSVLFMFHREKGKLEHELDLMFQCLPHYYKLGAGHGSGGEYLMQAEALYNQGDFAKAEIVAHKAQAFASQYDQLDNVLCAIFLHMRLALVQADYQQACDSIDHMGTLIHEARDYYLLHTADLCAGWLYGCLRQFDRIPVWLQSQDMATQRRLYTFADGFYYIVHGRALLLAGQNAQLLGLFEWLLESGRYANHAIFIIYAHLFLAAAHQRLGQQRAAEQNLRQALDWAMPDNICMPFVENFDFLRPLFANLDYPDMEQIYKLAHAWQKNISVMLSRYLSGVKLTSRELELAGLAAQGKKYAEIGKTLNLAPSTVKQAFTVIYNKLNIHNRQELRKFLADHDQMPKN